MPSPQPPIQLNHPRIPLLARATGLTLVVVFALLVLAAALPFNPQSSAWVALLRFGTLLEPEPDLQDGRREALRWARRRDQALLNLAENQQQQAGVSVQKRADQLRFELVRNTLRTLLIALAYLAGFRVLCGRSV